MGGLCTSPHCRSPHYCSSAPSHPLSSSGAVGGATLFWTAGMPEPLPLGAIRELRWWVARRLGPLTAFQAAAAALRVLRALAEQQLAVDARGEVLHPLPLAHRQMASGACLPHIAQARGCLGDCIAGRRRCTVLLHLLTLQCSLCPPLICALPTRSWCSPASLRS